MNITYLNNGSEMAVFQREGQKVKIQHEVLVKEQLKAIVMVLAQGDISDTLRWGQRIVTDNTN